MDSEDSCIPPVHCIDTIDIIEKKTKNPKTLRVSDMFSLYNGTAAFHFYPGFCYPCEIFESLLYGYTEYENIALCFYVSPKSVPICPDFPNYKFILKYFAGKNVILNINAYKGLYIDWTNIPISESFISDVLSTARYLELDNLKELVTRPRILFKKIKPIFNRENVETLSIKVFFKRDTECSLVKVFDEGFKLFSKREVEYSDEIGYVEYSRSSKMFSKPPVLKKQIIDISDDDCDEPKELVKLTQLDKLKIRKMLENSPDFIGLKDSTSLYYILNLAGLVEIKTEYNPINRKVRNFLLSSDYWN